MGQPGDCDGPWAHHRGRVRCRPSQTQAPVPPGEQVTSGREPSSSQPVCSLGWTTYYVPRGREGRGSAQRPRCLLFTLDNWSSPGVRWAVGCAAGTSATSLHKGTCVRWLDSGGDLVSARDTVLELDPFPLQGQAKQAKPGPQFFVLEINLN